jgi:hypothetical protein
MNRAYWRIALSALFLAGFAIGIHADASPLPTLKVEGDQIMAAGRPIHLRGINWGWWHLSGTVYSETDMQHVAGWGANVVRLAFSYSDVETEADPPVWNEAGFAQLDEVVQWARRYGVYVILDMHVVPGGQSTQPYCARGRNLIWSDSKSQAHFLALWQEIARRYRDQPEVAAYELMNEPDSRQATPEMLQRLDQRAIDAIRRVDPDKIVVVGGDRGSSAPALVAIMKLPDSNILYTFHWYEGADAEHAKIALTDQAFRQEMSPALAFAHQFHVPVWVGEFGCEARDKDYQARWVRTSITAFEKENLDWTYWNDRETSDPNGMGLHPEGPNGSDRPVNATLLRELQSGWARNAPR